MSLYFSSSSVSFYEIVRYLGPVLGVALLCGGLIGLERELKNKAAGIKTNMLICAGAALYTAMSVLLSRSFSDQGFYGDPGRVAAQIVSGIGFLGGGAIIQARGTVVGLTTAASIWVVAAVGIFIGLGYFLPAILASASVVGILICVTFLEKRFIARGWTFSCEIVAVDPDGSLRKVINTSLESHDLILEDFDVRSKERKSILTLRYKGFQSDHKRFLLDLWGKPGIQEIRQKLT